MALDFDLELKTNLTSKEILSMILELDGFRPADFENGFYADGVIGGTTSQEEKNGYYAQVHQNILKENFGFESDIKVWFRPDSYDNYEVGMQNVLKVLIYVLQKVQGDAVVLMNGESVKLLRKNNKLILNSESFSENNSVWTLNQIPFQYETKNLALIE